MKNLKLNALASESLSKIEMNQVTGGADCCSCGCQGPSSIESNAFANADGGKKATATIKMFVCDGISIQV